MSNISINTNVGAMVALQNLNATNASLSATQTRISTGLKVSSAKDNGAIYAIAQSQRATVSSLDAVKDSLNRTTSTVDVALAAGTSISDLLTQMKQKVLAAADTSLDSASRSSMNTEFQSLRDQITKTSQNASFNGVNLLDGSIANIQALANSTATSKLTVQAETMKLGGTIVTIAATAGFATATSAQALLTTLDTSLNNVNAALSKLGTSSKSVANHTDFVGKLQDSLTSGIGNLVDADLAKESANLQALQTKQQLGVQALSIANQYPQIVLGLFK